MDPVIRLIFLKFCFHLSATYIMIQWLPIPYRMKFNALFWHSKHSSLSSNFIPKSGYALRSVSFLSWPCVPHPQCPSFSSSNLTIFKGLTPNCPVTSSLMLLIHSSDLVFTTHVEIATIMSCYWTSSCF